MGANMRWQRRVERSLAAVEGRAQARYAGVSAARHGGKSMDGWQWLLITGLFVCGVVFLWIVWYERYPKLKNTLDSVLVRYVFRALRLAPIAGWLAGRPLLIVVLGGCTDTTPTAGGTARGAVHYGAQKSGHLLEERITIWTSVDAKREEDLIIAAAQQANRTPRVPVRSIETLKKERS